uniref:Putative neurotoxin 7 n=1 Tax=Scolopendra mutilans TaxID=2836329 RepID=PNX78_SCOMU|nr:RecName: Full=Putative neurotoxin 7; AltName: Full=Putative neurotoxin 8; Flags: Precursor [Scolopendra mutilans]AFM55027.1 putative neurotoxin 8 [Scolopendra subspinipes]
MGIRPTLQTNPLVDLLISTSQTQLQNAGLPFPPRSFGCLLVRHSPGCLPGSLWNLPRSRLPSCLPICLPRCRCWLNRERWRKGDDVFSDFCTKFVSTLIGPTSFAFRFVEFFYL